MKNFTDTKYTAYTWVNNLYLNKIQCGIQSAHCISEMSVSPFGKEVYEEWASKGKRMIIFEGRNSGGVRRTYEILRYISRNFARVGIKLPYIVFREDNDSLDGATTACGFIFPDTFREIDWDNAHELVSNKPFDSLLIHAHMDIINPYDVSTDDLYKKIQKVDAEIKVLHELRGYRNETNAALEPAVERFHLPEVTSWLSRQRTVK